MHRSLVVAVAAPQRLGYPWNAEVMAPYGELLREVARRDLDLAQEEESAPRYGIE